MSPPPEPVSRAASVASGGLAFVTRRPVAITMFMLAMVVFGAVSLSKLRVDLLPEISYPTLTVRTSWPGAAPEDVEERISERVQESLNTLPDLVRSSSISRAGTSDVVLDFDWGTNMSFAVQDVREKLDGVFLPRGAEKPLILRYDPNLDPILRIGVTGAASDTDTDTDTGTDTDTDTGTEKGADGDADADAGRRGRFAGRAAGRPADLMQLRWLAENRVKRELETLPGVAAVQVHGGLEEEVRVRLDPFKLAAHGLDPAAVGERLAQENINASGGALREGSTEYLVRTINEFQGVEEIADLAIADRGDAVIRMRDVATVERTHAKREVVSRIGGDEAVEIAIYREAGANIVQVAREVRERLFGTQGQQKRAREILAQQEQREERGEPHRPLNWDERRQTNYLAFNLRDELELETLSDQSTFIAAAVDDVRKAAVLGALLAIAVIWVFLRRLSATAIIGVAIPISVIVTFAPMFMMGVSLNIMSLGGLALGIGMLVDNAIVVLESITRCREEGDGPAEAAVRGVREVAGAVTASTLTTIAVFAPIVFVTGIAGQIFGDQALAVVTSLLVSLVVAVLFIPMLASRHWFAGGDGPATARVAPSPARRERRPWIGDLGWSLASLVPSLALLLGRTLMALATLLLSLVAGLLSGLYRVGAVLVRPISWGFDRLWNALEAGYLSLLERSLAHPLLVLVVAGALLWSAVARVPALGLELLPEIHQGEFTAHVKLDVGSPLERTDEVMTELDGAVRELEGIRTTALTVGIEPETLSREIEGSHTARLTVRLEPPRTEDGAEDGKITAAYEEAVETRVRELIERHPAVESVEFSRPTPFALEAPIAVEVRGRDLTELAQVSAQVRDRLAAIEGLDNIRTTVRPGHPEAQITFDRDLTLEYGLDLAAVSNLVRDQVLGNVSTRLSEGDDRIDIRLIGDEAILATLDDVLDLSVNPSSPTPVPLRAVADVRQVQGPAEIRRIGNSRAVLVSATGTGLDLGSMSSRIERALADLETPDDVVVELGGQKREMEEAQESMRFALLLAIFLVYVVMASQFESLLQPLIILLTVPLAGVGVVFALEALDVPLSVVVFIGLIMLAGIVVNNAIVLVDRINQKRLAGMGLHDAVIDAARARLRPILMTTATTVLGLLPLTGWLLGLPGAKLLGAGGGEGAEIRAPMAITVITGLAASTALTLIVIPVVYSLLSRRPPRARRVDMDETLPAELPA